MKVDTIIYRPEPPPPPPLPTIEVRLTFTVEEARHFFNMMEEHEQHALTYGGSRPKKQMARDIADKVHNACEEACR